MSHDLPDDWYEEHDGQRLVLSSEKVAAAIALARRQGVREGGTGQAMTVWIYEAGRDDMKVFASEETAQAWLDEHDPEGVAFQHPVIEKEPPRPEG